ncbi:MAG TPA: non-homologous end-joining DNA ligase [Mycobacteriales bacterium]|nr:non-homologous end-joining DNA ligase [Mycobacteriales bacterium]
MSSLDRYRAKRDPARTPEPVPPAGPEANRPRRRRRGDPSFVVQEHHARSLHWDFRLERDGVLVSWAVPKGLPQDRGVNHLAVHVEDHPFEYGSFEGRIPDHEYGAGEVTIWDQGTYECTKWTDREVKVTLHGKRAEGHYGLFHTDGNNWMIHRIDPAPPGWQPLPELIRPMLATPGELPANDDGWAYEFKWDGVRAVVYVEGGRIRTLSRTDRDVTSSYPELRGLGESLGSLQAVLDGEIVALDEKGRPSFEALQPRMNTAEPNRVRRLADSIPVTYMIFDLLHLDGHSALEIPYKERRRLLEGLELAGPHWVTPPSETGKGADVRQAARDAGLEGILAKRLDSPYRPGRRDPSWVKVKNFRTQSVVIGGWASGQGHLEGDLGALLLGVHDAGAAGGAASAGGLGAAGGAGALTYVGRVGTGFTDARRSALLGSLTRLRQETSPFKGSIPRSDAAGVTWVEPKLVGEVQFTEWTRTGRLRQPSWRGLRTDQRPEEVVREP